MLDGFFSGIMLKIQAGEGARPLVLICRRPCLRLHMIMNTKKEKSAR